MTIRSLLPGLAALLALAAAAGCGGDAPSLSSELDDSSYRYGQQLEHQGNWDEALTAYLKVIDRRGDGAPESNLNAGLIYLNHIRDPISAIYHFRRYLELEPNSKQAVFVKGMIDSAKREFARSLPGQPETALAISRVAVGLFFLLSGYHKLFDAQRHATLILTLRSAGCNTSAFFSGCCRGAEFSGGLAVAVGLLSVPAALGLLIISIGATVSDGIKRIGDWRPIDKADFLDDMLYLPEVLYALLLLCVILAGPGPYSVDALIAAYF